VGLFKKLKGAAKVNNGEVTITVEIEENGVRHCYSRFANSKQSAELQAAFLAVFAQDHPQEKSKRSWEKKHGHVWSAKAVSFHGSAQSSK
jgi:hypothetical protein